MVGGGRVAAFEILIATYAVKNIVRDGRTGQLRNQIATSARDGMRTLETSLTELVAEGLVSYEEAITHSLFPDEVQIGDRAWTLAAAPRSTATRPACIVA